MPTRRGASRQNQKEANRPYTAKIARSIIKPPKVFFFDNADTSDEPGMRLENLVATTLLKRLHWLEDYEGYRFSLHYIRDKDDREVDFLTIVDGKIHELIEVKASNASVSTAFRYYAEKLRPKYAVQLVGDLKRGFDDKGIQVRNPIEYFKNPIWV